MIPQIPLEQETQLVERAMGGDETAFAELVEPFRKPLFSYIYRMVTNAHDAEDLMQDVLIRTLEGLRTYRGESRFKTWLFGIASHTCMDHLRNKRRWRVEAQLIGQQVTEADSEAIERVGATLSQPDFVFEIREHIAFCFSCVSRTLEPEEQAALMLREVLGFNNQEAAGMIGISEPVFRHRLSAARSKMRRSYEGLCQLINKTGACWQCRGLREFTPEANRGHDLVQIEVLPGATVTSDNLFDARLKIVREAAFPESSTRPLHDSFFEGLNRREEENN
ncbi:MAG TPA: RNA polymerase sigma factor [Blastocatellia bacterium]|nr:RNA polymerase sigma factor [Blastocatellia bacterium]